MPEIVSPVTRRGFLAGAGILGLGLAGCGAAPDGAGPGPGAPDTVDFAFEDVAVTVPARPRRVVVVEGRGDLEFALLAGWPLAGIRNVVAPGERPAGQYAGLVDDEVPLLESAADRPDPEEVAALAPDLIVLRANSWRLDSYGNEVLARIAPLLPVEVNRPDFRSDMTAQLGQFTTGDQAASALRDYDAAVADGQAAVAALGRVPRVALMSTQMAASGSVRLWTHRLATTVATDLGLDVLALDRTDTEGELSLSLEEIGRVASADLVLHQTPEPAPVAGTPTWEALPAVLAGRAHTLDPALNNGLALTATALARRMTTALAG